MTNNTFGGRVLNFYRKLTVPNNLPPNITIMNPYEAPEVRMYIRQFLKRFFTDKRKRVYVLGINPGRFGAGVTGVTFTDPVALEKFCGINNTLDKRREISSEFIYSFIQHWGGAEKFYRDFFLTAVSPLGFTNDGVNYNYYDDRALISLLKPFIVETMNAQLTFGARRGVVIILGTGKNYRVFQKLNDEYGFFKKIYPLEHPRFIMQYRRQQLPHFIEKYQRVFSQALSES